MLFTVSGLSFAHKLSREWFLKAVL